MQKKVMRYPAQETAAKHARIVKEASRLFRERGFENVSVGEVMKAAGLTHGALARGTEIILATAAPWPRWPRRSLVRLLNSKPRSSRDLRKFSPPSAET